MKGKYAILWVLLLIGFCACADKKSITDTLQRAEVLMDEHPDSAYTLLQTLPVDELHQEKNRARYALLYSQALDKNYIDETNDSLISIAVDYYRHTDDVRHKFLSYYYKGRVHYNAKDYLNATSCYMEAEQLADEVGDDYLLGLLYGELGRIYNIYYDFPKSLEVYQRSAEHYEQAGKLRHRDYIWLNQSNVLRSMKEYEEAERLLRMALFSAKGEGDNTLKEMCLGDLVMLHIEHGQMSEAGKVYSELQLIVGDDFGTSSFWGKMAEMYASEQNFEQAKQCMERGWSRVENKTDSVNMYFSSACLHDLLGDGDRAYWNLQQGIVLQNQDVREALQQPILTAQRDYLSEKLELEAYRLRLEKKLKLLSILLGVSLLIIMSYVFKKLIKKWREEAQRTIRGLEKLKEQAEKDRERIEIDKRKLEEENFKISSLLQKMDRDKSLSDQTIKDLKNEIVRQEKENNETISRLVQNLEDENKANVETIACLRESLESKEKVYRLYEQKNEKVQKDLQDAIGIKFGHISVLLKDKFEFMGEWILLYEEELTLKNYREKKIKRAVDDTKTRYFKGKNAFHNLEQQVNLYFDNAMLYFREEIQLADEKDYSRVCCLFAGIPPHIIAWMMNEKTDVVYQRKSRLRKKIASFPYIHQSLFLRLLPK